MAIIPELAVVGKPMRLLKCQPIVNHPASAMRNNPGLPDKDEFVQKLNTKLQARLSMRFVKLNSLGSRRPGCNHQGS
jgi:hypothetical protein